MINFVAKPLGILLRFVFDFLDGINLDFEILSAYAISIIVTTIIFKLILLPLTIKQTRSMKGMQEIQPELQKIQKKYKDDPQTLGMKQMELYKENNVSLTGGCFPLLLQMPILLAYFRVMREPIEFVFGGNTAAYETINKSFFWVQDIALSSGELIDGVVNEISIAGFTIPLLAIIAALTTYFSTKMMTASQPQPQGNDQAASTQKMMTMITPFMILMIGYTNPIGLVLYWTVSNLFQIGQQLIVKKFVAVTTDVKEVK